MTLNLNSQESTQIINIAPNRLLLDPSNCLHIMNAEQIAQEVSRQLVTTIKHILELRPFAVISPSAGQTLQRTYKVLRKFYRSSVDWSRVICVQMDEYANVSTADPRSFAHQLINDFVNPMGIGSFISFYDQDGKSNISPMAFEKKIRSLGGIDLAIHGVGRNRHIALNEPESVPMGQTRIVQLAPSTQNANDVPFRHGITLGMDVLCAAKSTIVVLLGTKKRAAAEALLFHPAGPFNPVGHLRTSSQTSIFIDHDALPRIMTHPTLFQNEQKIEAKAKS